MYEMDIARAWKDQDYRNSLTASERAVLPDNPAGMIELTDMELEKVAGGTFDCHVTNADVCNNSNNCCGEPGTLWPPVDFMDQLFELSKIIGLVLRR